MSNAAQGRLAGRRAVVTGAGLGIGRAIALRLAAEGCDVGVFDRSAADSQETARLIASAGRRVAVATGDVASLDQVRAGMDALAAAQLLNPHHSPPPPPAQAVRKNTVDAATAMALRLSTTFFFMAIINNS